MLHQQITSISVRHLSSVTWPCTLRCFYMLRFFCSVNVSVFVFFTLAEKIERTVQIEASTVEIEERGVKLRLTVVDTPGYGDAINSQDWSVYVCVWSGGTVERG